jgi:DNA-binding NarL/FixJ family response regulator
MDLSRHGVDLHLRQICPTLRVRTRAEVARLAIEHDLY